MYLCVTVHTHVYVCVCAYMSVVSVMVKVLPNDGGSFPPPPQSVDDKLPSIPSSGSLTGGISQGGLGCIDELASESAESMSDGDDTLSGPGNAGRSLVLPKLVTKPSDLIVPSRTGPPKTQRPVCHPERYCFEPDTFSELQALDVRKTHVVPILRIIIYL